MDKLSVVMTDMLMPQMWVKAQSDTVNWTYYCSCDTDLHFNNPLIGLGDTAEREKTADGAQRDIFEGYEELKKQQLCTQSFFIGGECESA